VIARNKTMHQSAAARAGTSSRKTPRKRVGVIAFPVFESYGDQIVEWLSALGDQKPNRIAVERVTLSLRRAVASLELVRNSPRHTNMACLMRHTLEALRASEWEGARYLLMTAFALMSARVLRTGACLNDPVAGGAVLQFPLPEMPTELTTEEAVTGIVTG
jgi:hypothetical protein